MARKRREDVIEATSERIKAAAWTLMHERGTAGLAIREIARAIDMTAPALYYYFASLDDLITTLILDAFNAMADTLEVARDSVPTDAKQPATKALFAVSMAYRAWAVANPMAFQLIYGNPIPSYVAPAAITVPAASRSGEVFTRLLWQALKTGEFQVAAAYREIPASIRAHILGYFVHIQTADEPVVIDEDLLHAQYLMTIGWSQIHGVVMLEMFHHIGPVVGDVDVYFRSRVIDMMRSMGATM